MGEGVAVDIAEANMGQSSQGVQVRLVRIIVRIS